MFPWKNWMFPYSMLTSFPENWPHSSSKFSQNEEFHVIWQHWHPESTLKFKYRSLSKFALSWTIPRDHSSEIQKAFFQFHSNHFAVQVSFLVSFSKLFALQLFKAVGNGSGNFCCTLVWSGYPYQVYQGFILTLGKNKDVYIPVIFEPFKIEHF